MFFDYLGANRMLIPVARTGRHWDLFFYNSSWGRRRRPPRKTRLSDRIDQNRARPSTGPPSRWRERRRATHAWHHQAARKPAPRPAPPQAAAHRATGEAPAWPRLAVPALPAKADRGVGLQLRLPRLPEQRHGLLPLPVLADSCSQRYR